MKLIYQRAGAIYVWLGPAASDRDLAMKTSADSASVYFFLAFMKAMDSCKLDSFVLSQSLLSIFGLILQFQARPHSSYNITFQLRVFAFLLLQHPAHSKQFFLFARAVHLELSDPFSVFL
jgi:hypothetical protein